MKRLLTTLTTLTAVAAAALFAGCASTGGTAPTADREIRTDSDQTELDRRASIRLELAQGYFSRGQFNMTDRPPNMERPRTVEALAPGFERMHQEAVARIRPLSIADLDRELPFFGRQVSIREILWDMIILHGVHHRGQLALMCRLAGGDAPGLYGPNREETAAMRAAAPA